MTFRKNLIVMLIAIALVLVASYFIGVPRTMLVDGITLSIAIVALTLLINDCISKYVEKSDLITWEYAVGIVLVLGSIVSFLWAAESVTNQEMFVRLGITTFLCFVGGVWFYIPYAQSVEAIETSEKRIWTKVQSKLAKLKDPKEAEALLFQTLRYYLVDDDISSNIDVSRPLIILDDAKSLPTYKEMMEYVANTGGGLQKMEEYGSEAKAYINGLVKKLFQQNQEQEQEAPSGAVVTG